MTIRGNSRTRTKLMMACAALAVMPASAYAQGTAPTRFDIKTSDLGTAITEVARQGHREIFFSADLTRGKRAPRLRGNLTVEQALSQLLSGSGLIFRVNASGSIVVERAGQVGNVDSDDVLADYERGKSEILVVGSRTQNVDIRRTEDDAQPYVVFTREEVAASQATTVEEFLRTRLPQNSGAGGPSTQFVGNGPPYSQFNLRGLGSNQTLILVNGRRLAALGNENFAPRQSDINGIPMGSIERIEVLPSSAGGIYGGQAVGGVINIILRSGYRGLEVIATYNDSVDFAVPNGRLDINGGLALEGGRTNITFGGSISRAGTLRVGDRTELMQRGIDLYRRNVDVRAGTDVPPVGNGVNIRSATGAPLVLDNGMALGSTITNVPLGYAGYASDGGALLRTNAGTFNLQMPDGLLGRDRGLLTSPEAESFNVNVRRKFSSAFDIFVDFSRLVNRGVSYNVNQIPNTVTIAANAPTNPFQQNIRVSYPIVGLSYPFRRSSETNRLTIGTIARLPGNWAANLEYNKTWATNGGTNYQIMIDRVGTNCLTAGTTPCSRGPALNPLQSPVDLSPYLFDEPTSVSGPYTSQLVNPSLRLSGPLFRLPGGSANLTLVVQRESTVIDTTRNRSTNALDRKYIYTIIPRRSQRTTSGYAEIVLPLVSPSNDIPLVRELELRGAVRRDSYLTTTPPAGTSSIDLDLGTGTRITQISGFAAISTSNPDLALPTYKDVSSRFQSTNFTLAGRWSPMEGVALRASYATGFLPPSVIQIASQTGSGVMIFADPFRGNSIENYGITVFSSGSVILKPETSKSLSAGVILTPVRGLRLSADYSRIQKRNEIGSIPTEYLINNPDLFPGRVVRAAPAPTDPPGYLGRIVSLDQTLTNLLRSQFQAIDFQADYDLETGSFGRFQFYALATWQPESVRQLVPAARAPNFTGNADGKLEWQGNGGVNWSKGNLGIRWNTQFYSAYNVYPTQQDNTPTSIFTTNLYITQQGGRRIPSQAYSDLYVSYDFKDAGGVLNGVRVTAGVQNIFNRQPPVIAIPSYTSAGYSTYGDPRLRRFSVSLRKAFGGQ
ncbi:MAG: hypothetical protein EOP61_02890 [Sphingomonadales bacterium]|nr:MAG: hypothetical protein EOP61_02890 [Sphingomonadales bacterium]